MRIPFVVMMLAAPAVWASPPTTNTVAAKKVPAPAKAEPARPVLDRQPQKKAAPVMSTLSLKKKPHRVLLADWAP